MREELTKELLKSKKRNKLTRKSIKLCQSIIDSNIDRYHIDEEHFERYKLAALQSCKEHGMNFIPERLNNGFAFITQIVRCSFANTYSKISKEKKSSVNI